MKICFIELMPFPYKIGGGTTHLINLGKALAELGHEVHVISSRPGKSYPLVKNAPRKVILHNVGMPHKKFEKGIFSYYLYRMFFEISFVLGAMKELKKINPDIIDCQSSITTALPASLSKYPFVITCHGIHEHGFGKLYSSKGNKFTAKFLNKIYLAISKYNVKKTIKLISQGRATLDYYLNLAGDSSKGVLVQNLVDTEFWKYSTNKQDNLIATVARLTKQKALDKLILAMKLLPNYRLKIAGEGELEKELKSIAGKNVEFLGYQNPNDCLKLYSKARFTVLPSEFEGLPYSILEAMSAGVIPITTKVGDLPTLIQNGKNGFLLQNNNPKTISDVIKSAEKMNLKRISEASRQTIMDKHGSKKVAEAFVKEYKRCLSLS